MSRKSKRPPREADTSSDDEELTRPTVRPSHLYDPARSGSVDVAFSQASMPAAPADSGSVDVAFSQASMPAAPAERAPDTSGSVDVGFSQLAMPAASADEPTPGDADAGAGAPADGPSVAPAAVRPAATRRRRPTTVAGRIGASLTNLPVVKAVMPRSSRAQLLVRSTVVAFGLIASWILTIIWLQTRAAEKPDFRPQASAIFAELREGNLEQVYRDSSERFQEMVLREKFDVIITDMTRALGAFLEVAAVKETKTFRGPSGRIGRVDLLLDFEKGRASGSVSFRWEDGGWKMLGLWVELPEDVAKVETGEQARKDRVKLPPEIKDLVIKILEQTRDGQDDAIWEAAHADLFQASISRKDFHAVQEQRRETLGPFRRLLDITSGKGDTARAGLDTLLEFGNNVTITGSFRFVKVDGVYRLSFYKLIMPMPKAAD